MLSAVIITKNEELNIARTIDHLLDWVDEIVVFDSGSIDETLNILRAYRNSKIKIYEVDWQGFAMTKNQAIAKTKADWVLSVDADEVITKKLKQEILEVLSVSSGVVGYKIPRLLYFCGRPVRYGGTYPDYQLRLFKKDLGRFENIPVHESIKLRGEVSVLKNHMLHFSYNTIFEYWTRFNKYTELDAEKKLRQGKRFNFCKVFVFHWELFRRLIVKKGLLDGIPGIFYHIFSSLSSLVKYAKLWEISR
ncbi:MAG: glycosyltransferase family 2 protein [bacterium]|nr:glycosyltransferase family 2 protein [bacterium]